MKGVFTRQDKHTSHGRSPTVQATYAGTHYATLSCAVGAAAKVVHARFKLLALEFHPDKASPAQRKAHVKCSFRPITPGCAVCERGVQFATISAAWSVLKDAARRRQYDAQLQLAGVVWCGRCNGRGAVQQRLTVGFSKECPNCKGKGVQE